MSKNKPNNESKIQNNHTSNDLLGEEKVEWTPKPVKMGDTVLFTVNGNVENEVLTYPAIVMELHEGKPGVISINLFRKAYIEWQSKVQQSETKAAGFYTVCEN